MTSNSKGIAGKTVTASSIPAGLNQAISPFDTPICDIKIADPEFGKGHLQKLAAWYARAPFLAPTLSVLQAVYFKGHVRLPDLTSELTIALAHYIGLKATFGFAHDFNIQGDKRTRPLSFARALGSTVYLTQAGTREYTDVPAFQAHSIKVVFLDFSHPVYKQPRAPFTPYLSVVDMLMNIGPEESAAVIRSIRLDGEESNRGA
jgi:hypothetical protein